MVSSEKSKEKEKEEEAEDLTASQQTSSKCNPFVYVPRRIIMAVFCCVAMIIIHAMRVNIAITVVTILDDSHQGKLGSNQASESLPKVDWNSRMIGFLHSVFYIGFLLTQIPGGYVATRFPGTRIFGGSILFSCALNMVLPVAIAKLGYVATCIVRFFQGLSEGFLMPALYEILHTWFRPCSVHKYGGWILGGMYAGPIIGFPLGGVLTHYVNWQYVYYLHGAFGILWFAFWVFMAYESPESHPSISKEELQYIISDRKHSNSKHLQIPWKEIFLSLPVWSIVICHFVKSWFFILMLTNEPTYLNQFHFTMLENGIFSALPHVLKVLMSFTSGYMADALLTSKMATTTVTRKLFTCFGFGIEGFCCYLLYFVSDRHGAIAILSIGICVSGLAVSGWQINHLDLAPDFASVLVGLSATVGTLGGIMSPLIIGVMTHPQTLYNWQKAFLLNGSVLIFGAITYAIFGSSEKQPWADATESEYVLGTGKADVQKENSCADKSSE